MREDVAASAGETQSVSVDSHSLWARAGWMMAASAVVAGVGLRFSVQSDLWLDEALTVNIAELPLDHLREALVRDGAPPLYYVVLHFWISLFGASDGATRALSGVLGVAAIGLAYLVATRFGRDPRERRWLGVSSALVIAASPYAIHYSSEVRMYSLSMALVLLGGLVGLLAWDSPTTGWLVGVAVVTAALLYTQYWSLFLVSVVGVGMVIAAGRGMATTRRRARRVLAAMVTGCVLFVPWIPTLRVQLVHTGTPWDAPAGLVRSTAHALRAFAGGNDGMGWVSMIVLGALIVIAAFGAHGVRMKMASAIAFGTLLLGIAVSAVTGVGFQDRYAVVVFPIVVLVAVTGLLSVQSLPTRGAVLTVVAVLGLMGGMQVIDEERTASTEIAATLRPVLDPGDVVAYCPDQLGPSTDRILGRETRDVTFPELSSPKFVDWTDYAERHANASPARFVTRVDSRAGAGRIWLVWSPGYRTLSTLCEQVVNEFEAVRPEGVVVRVADGPHDESVELRRFDR